ncbi:MAG: pseudouridine synthase [Pseudomonadota bacterium]
MEKGERIAKIIARAGICSRRDAEKLIESGKVEVNGSKIKSPALNVTSRDEVFVEGKKLPVYEGSRLWMYYKPVGIVTTHKDEQGRKTVFDDIPKYLPRMVSVGRLDLNTEGLMLLTNDGEIARHIELPSTGWKRRYRVRIYGLDSADRLERIKHGVTIDGITYGKVEVELEKHDKNTKNIWAIVTICEGKNREIRKLFEHIDCKVSRLIRIGYGAFQLGNMKAGEIKEVPRKVLLSQLGKLVK